MKLVVRALLAVVHALSPATREALVRGLASIVWALGIRRRVALENVARALPDRSEAERERIVRGAYESMALAVLDGLTSDTLSDEALAQAVEVVDWKGLDGLLAQKQPVLLASAHLGSWELFAEVMARRGYVFSAVVRPLTGAFNQALVQRRVDAGIELILQRGALKRMVSALRRGRAVVQLIDQALPSSQAVWVPFFGRLASTTPAISMAAVHTGAPVYVLVAVRESGRLRMYVEGPVPLPPGPDRDVVIREHTATLTAILETYVRRHPEQWLWLHRRWKGKPPDQIDSRSSTPA